MTFHFLDSLFPIDTDVAQSILPIIFDAHDGEKVPKEFNSVKVKLNGRLDSNLDWKKEIGIAEEYISKGLRIFWELDLGLFQDLRWPLEDQTQFLALGLSVTHFRDTVWKKFAPQTAGLSLYRGSLRFTLDADPLSARNAAFDYIHLLSQNLPSNVLVSILLETNDIEDPLLLAMLLNVEESRGLIRAIQDGVVGWQAFQTSSHGYLARKKEKKQVSQPTIGICMPNIALYTKSGHERMLEAINELKMPFRFLSEAFLTSEWQDLDALIVLPEWISEQGKRKLKGFCAAGGIVVTVGSLLGLDQEVTFSQWMEK